MKIIAKLRRPIRFLFSGWMIGMILLISAAPGSALDLTGHFIQGGLLFGEVAPGTRVTYQGRSLRVSPKGRFIIGLDRDAPLASMIEVRRPDGSRESHPLVIDEREYQIQRIDGLPPRKVDPDPDDLARIRAESGLVKTARKRDDPRTDFAEGFIWPVTGRITGVYGSQRILNGKPRRPHYGVDIAAPTGTPVKAPADGVVSLVHPDMFYSGGTLILDHGHGLSSSFLHLHRIRVGEGQAVRQGSVIAEVGATGRVTGPHLDWRMNWFDQRIDPVLLSGPMPGGGEHE